MTRCSVALVVVLSGLLAVCGRVASAAPPVPDVRTLVKVSVSTNTPKTSYTQPVKLALTFKIAPKWHIYWLNPGDSGVATAIKLTLPEGWKQSDVRFPTPVRFTQPGDLVGYGYKDEVTFLVDVTPPATFVEGEAKIGVEAVYLVCDHICIPGQEKLTVVIPAGAPDYPPNYTEFVELEGRIPYEFSATSGVKMITEGAVRNDKDWELVTTRVQMPFGGVGLKGATYVVFPLPPDDMEVRNLVVEPTKDGLVIKFEGKLYSGKTIVPDRLSVVVATESSEGRRSSYRLDLPTSAGTAETTK